jgi:HAD superfamily hydrolase (TIGR01549 family)
MIKTFLFDLDGTLIDTPPMIIESFQSIFKQYLPDLKLTQKDYESFLGQPLNLTIAHYEKDENKAALMIEAYHQRSNEKIDQKLIVYPKTLETLKYMKSKNAKIGVVTSKMRTKAEKHLMMSGLLEYIDLIIGYEDVDKHKPHPESLHKAMSLLKANPHDTLYIGDHENDIKAAKNAGILSCAVSYSVRLKEMLLENPDFVIDAMSHLKDLI